MPTTAGTAAEVTINYVITDVEKKRKFVCVDTNDIPEIAVVDPDMMASMPKGLTAATGMDALTHAIEGYICLLYTSRDDLEVVGGLLFGGRDREHAQHEDQGQDQGEYLLHKQVPPSIFYAQLALLHTVCVPQARLRFLCMSMVTAASSTQPVITCCQLA